MIELDSGYSIRSLGESSIADFHCAENLLKVFQNDAADTEEELIAKTYFLHHSDFKEPLVGFCVSNSSIRANPDVDMTLPDNVRHGAYPAVLIGEFATHTKFAGKDFGRRTIGFLKAWFVTQNKTGCRYIVADSVPESVGFYEKCGFERFPEQRSTDTILMFFDLKAYEIAFKRNLDT